MNTQLCYPANRGTSTVPAMCVNAPVSFRDHLPLHVEAPGGITFFPRRTTR